MVLNRFVLEVQNETARMIGSFHTNLIPSAISSRSGRRSSSGFGFSSSLMNDRVRAEMPNEIASKMSTAGALKIVMSQPASGGPEMCEI